MKLLEDRIRSEGKVLPGDIIKVDGFLNHRVDVSLLRECAKEFGRLFDTSKITCVVTIEASGIPIATVCAEEFGVPLIYAKKAKSDNISGDVYTSDIRSYTYNKPVKLTLSDQDAPCEGGFLLLGGSYEKDCSLNALMAELRLKEETNAARILFT